MQAYALSSLFPSPITYSYSPPNSLILHSLTMEPHLVDWQLETTHTTTNTNHEHDHAQHHQDDDEYIEDEDEDEDENEDKSESEDKDGLDFTFTCIAPDSSPVSAEEIFLNGQIKPLNPIFYHSLNLHDHHRAASNAMNNNKSSSSSKPVPIRLPLVKLMSQEEDRDFSFASISSTSCSSSEAADEELEGIAPESYCVWTPNAKKESKKIRCKKSNSTGTMSSSSKRWTLRDMLLSRSHSDNNGKTTFVLFKSKQHPEGKEEKQEEKSRGKFLPNSLDTNF